MNKDLHSYLKIYHNRIPDSMCDSILAQIKNQDWTQHSFYSYKTNTTETHDRDLSVSHYVVQENSELMDTIWKSLHQYMVELNFTWYNSWNGFSAVRWNKYDVDTVMNEHCDHIHTLFDGERKGIPTLTILGVLNDDYKGGKLVMFSDEVIECKKGDLLVFPSNFLYPHRVDAVKEGTRFSFVSWVW